MLLAVAEWTNAPRLLSGMKTLKSAPAGIIAKSSLKIAHWVPVYQTPMG